MQKSSRVDVWLAGPTAAQLTPPPRSLVDGGEAVSVVRTCCLGRSGPGRLKVSLAVDQATAERFATACRRESLWKRRIYPAMLVAVAVEVAVFVTDVVHNDSRLQGWLMLAAVILAGASLAGRLVLTLSRSRHHPRVVEGNNVLVRSVDGQVARTWADLNPPGAVEILK